MILQLDDLDEATIGRHSTQDQPIRGQLLTIGVVEFIAMTMALTDLAHSIHLLRECAFSQLAKIRSEPHRAAFVADGMLIGHEMDDGMR
jgi:hypothetical protein